ncbi:MAG: type VII toxin-antitoxin system HepT family RNase toxin [Candidatus Rokuibacteriota bacterium]
MLALDEALQVLRAHQGRSVAKLVSDREERWIVERGLQLCAQNTLDIATHLAASAGHDVPDYAAAIDRLAEMRILPPDFAVRLRGVAGFRNVVVHGYLDVEVALLHRLLNDHLDDFSVFAQHVGAYLASLGIGP